MAEGLSLSALLPDRLDSAGSKAKDVLCENEDIGCMKLAWDHIAGELGDALRSALDCDLLEVFARGWAQAGLLADYADPAKHPPGERNLVSIGEHEVKRELHPVVTVTIAPCPSVDLKFTLTIAAKFDGLQLTIIDGHIVGGRTGQARATAQLSYGDTPLHPKRESKTLDLPGEFRFDAPGIPLEPLRRARRGGQPPAQSDAESDRP